jgi:Flp pilus assembly protein TadB
VTIWAFLLAILGIGLCVYGANTSMGAKLGEQSGRGAKLSAASGRLALRGGMMLVALGAGLFVLGIIVHTIVMLVTLAFFAVVVLAAFSLWGRARRPRTR